MVVGARRKHANRKKLRDVTKRRNLDSQVAPDKLISALRVVGCCTNVIVIKKYPKLMICHVIHITKPIISCLLIVALLLMA